MAKKIIFILVLLVLGWWAFGFVTAILDSRAKMPAAEMDRKMSQYDPIRKSGYRTYKVNFTGGNQTSSDILKHRRDIEGLAE